MGRNKKVFIFFGLVFFLCAVFWLSPHIGFAADKEESSGAFFGSVLNGIKGAITWILYYAVFTPITWLVSVAVALFAFAVNADLISGPTGLLNQPEIYELWKFIRDFCNIFFILMLLIGAFSLVFQLSSYNAKKTLLSIVLMALFVNFSFPLSRVLIDVSSVPTYFFIQQILGSGGGKSLSDVASKSFLSASKMENLLLPKGEQGATVSSLIVAIVFMFLFGVALCILAVLFVVRVVSLVVLVIFSPIGFMKFVPGLSGYANDWWKKFIENLVFAPAAMLMLLVSIRFANVMQSYNTTLSAEASAVSGDSGLTAIFGTMLKSAVPIILIMMTISVALSSKVAGVGMAKKVNDKLMAWGKRGGFYNNSVTRGLASGLKQRAEENKYTKPFTPKYWSEKSKNSEERMKGLGRGGVAGYNAANADIQQNKIMEAAKANKDRNVSNSELLKNLDSGDKVRAAAAAMTLSENKAISNPEDLKKAAKALEALGKNASSETGKLLTNARSGAFKMDAGKIKELLNGESFAQRGADGQAMKNADGSYVVDESSNLYKDFSSKMRSEGQIKSFADYRIQTETARIAATGATPDAAKIRQDVYNDTIGKLSATDLAKQSSIHDSVGSDVNLQGYMQDYANKYKKNYEKAMETMSATDQAKWNSAGIVPAPTVTPAAATPASSTAPNASSSTSAAQSQREKLREVGRRNNRRS